MANIVTIERSPFDFSHMVDEEVVLIAKEGDSSALDYIMKKYEGFVKLKAKSYFLIGADKEDIYQEGMIGLYKAVRDFKLDKLASFKGFAELCITRQIITAIKAATRQKHIPLNTYVSINKPIYEDDECDRTLADVLPNTKITDPQDLMISSEEVSYIQKEIVGSLSELEIKVLNAYIEGKSYQEIACDLDKRAKSIDNALQRLKRKLEKSLNRK